MTLPTGQQWLFSIRTFAAAMAALYLALWFDLQRPYWAMATVYIASQSFAGATRSKGAYRAIGTVLGGAAALFLVPLLVDAPILLSLALALWVGFCLFFALLDRTPRSYAFMLGGYSAAIIGFPSVTTPDAIFDTVLSRVEEILLGIACATFFATVLFPRSAGPALGTRIAAWLREADEWALEALAGHAEDDAYIIRRRHLAAGVSEIDGLASSLAWDDGAGPEVARSMTALRQRLLMLLPLLSSVDDRVRALSGADSGRAAAAIGATAEWVRSGAPAAGRAAVAASIDALDSAAAGRHDWPGLLLASLGQRLREFLALRTTCDALLRQVTGLEPLDRTFEVAAIHHRDPAMAMLSAAAAVVAVLLCCVGWIATAWPEGAVAAEMAAVVCSFFAQQDNPVPAIITFLRWSVVAVVIDAVILFGLLPPATSFEMVVLALAPVFIPFGLLIATPATMQIGMALGANGATLLGIQATYSADFAGFANSGLALMVGMALGAVITALMRSVGAEWSVRRLLRANWVSLAEAARGYGRGDREQLAAILLDRVALVATRLSASDPDSDVHRLRPLADIRVGLNVVELRRGRRGLPAAARTAVEAALDALAGHFATLARGGDATPPPGMVADLHRALEAVGRAPRDEAQRNALQGLVGIYRGLCPARTPDVELVAA